jgi:hypothetical protein
MLTETHMLLLALAAVVTFQPQQYSGAVLSCRGAVSSVAFISPQQGSPARADMKFVDVIGGSKLVIDLNSGVVKSEKVAGMDAHAFDFAVVRRTDEGHAKVDFVKASCDGAENKTVRLAASSDRRVLSV